MFKKKATLAFYFINTERRSNSISMKLKKETNSTFFKNTILIKQAEESKVAKRFDILSFLFLNISIWSCGLSVFIKNWITVEWLIRPPYISRVRPGAEWDRTPLLDSSKQEDWTVLWSVIQRLSTFHWEITHRGSVQQRASERLIENAEKSHWYCSDNKSYQ